MAQEAAPTPGIQGQSQTQYERQPTYWAAYSNNVQIEHSAFDCKLKFGQYDGPNVVKQHFAVTMAWAEAKALASHILANIAFYEGINGKIQMPRGIVPTPPQFDGADTDPTLRKVQERITRVQSVIFDEE